MYKIVKQNFFQYVTAYLVRIWTCEHADEEARTFSRRNKNAKKKRTKNGYCVNSLLDSILQNTVSN